MKRIFYLLLFVPFTGLLSQQKEPAIKDSFLLLEPIELRAIRAGSDAPFTHSILSRKDIEKLNTGPDLPFLLNQTPSVVVHSDAGNGVGYTGLRIRGTDASRINVTLNGVPFNDAESQGTFFVDLPDFASSVSSIQVQRGVGTSSNGTGAFGASINISTNEVNTLPYAEYSGSAGSFNTWKNTFRTGSGLLGKHFTTDFRLSNISSDGYIDRAGSDLSSFYFSTAYLNQNASIRFNFFSGKEKTYQAWYGVSEADLQNNRTINYAGTERPGTPYENETDNYKQDHFQLFYNQKISSNLKLNVTLFYVKGAGYYEQYKAEEAYDDYGLEKPVYGNQVITHSDLIRQLWLDNDFYGNLFSLHFNGKKNQLTLGGGWNRYLGNHFGDVIWAEKGLSLPARWYDLDAFKNDFSLYLKQESKLSQYVSLFYDLQYRSVQYDIEGFRNNPSLQLTNDFRFFNPKIGARYRAGTWSAYLSYSRGQKEPNRDDFEAGTSQVPKPEKLNDLEMGVEKKGLNYQWAINGYYMKYKDQLVLTGQINDVGAYTRTNIPDSYRMGIEMSGAVDLSQWFRFTGHLAISRNKIRNFTEYIDDYDAGGQKINRYTLTDIAFSPGITGGTTLNFIPVKNWELSLMGKYVGDQYLDNTSNEARKLSAFYTQDARIQFTTSRGAIKELKLFFLANNILNRLYEPNGYTFSYIWGGNLVTENYYYPMAGRNFTAGIQVKL